MNEQQRLEIERQSRLAVADALRSLSESYHVTPQPVCLTAEGAEEIAKRFREIDAQTSGQPRV